MSTNGHGFATFAGLLALYRTRHGLSQSRLAHEAGFDHSYISRLEAGKREPSRETVTVLAHELRLDARSLDSLLVAAGFRPVDDSNIFPDEPVISDLARLLRDPRLPEATRATIREMMTLLVKQWSATITA